MPNAWPRSGESMGTHFIATDECTAHPDYKRAIVDADADDVVLSEKITGVPVSVIKTPFIERMGICAGPPGETAAARAGAVTGCVRSIRCSRCGNSSAPRCMVWVTGISTRPARVLKVSMQSDRRPRSSGRVRLRLKPAQGSSVWSSIEILLSPPAALRGQHQGFRTAPQPLLSNRHNAKFLLSAVPQKRFS